MITGGVLMALNIATLAFNYFGCSVINASVWFVILSTLMMAIKQKLSICEKE